MWPFPELCHTVLPANIETSKLLNLLFKLTIQMTWYINKLGVKKYMLFLVEDLYHNSTSNNSINLAKWEDLIAPYKN